MKSNAWTVLRRLGDSGASVSYLAEERRTGRKLVVKELSLARISSWREVDIFRREAAILRRLRHPCIPEFVGEHEYEGGVGITRVHVPGVPVRAWIRDGKPLTESPARLLARRLLETVAYLESRSPPVRLRELTPDNVILDALGHVFLIGLGSAKLQSQTGSIFVGNLDFVAPELLRGGDASTSDLYGVGAVTFFALQGVPPRVRDDGVSPLAHPEYVLRVGAPFRAWLGKMLAPVGERFASASEALEALGRLEAAPRLRSKRFIGSREKSLLLVAAGMFTLGSAILAAGVSLPRAGDEPLLRRGPDAPTFAAPLSLGVDVPSPPDHDITSCGPEKAPVAAGHIPFDPDFARLALRSVNVGSCKSSAGPTGEGHVVVTFGTDGRARSAVVNDARFAGTAVGDCVARRYLDAGVPAFSGSEVKVGKTFSIDSGDHLLDWEHVDHGRD